MAVTPYFGKNGLPSFLATSRFGATCWTRTNDPAVNSRMLYRLS